MRHAVMAVAFLAAMTVAAHAQLGLGGRWELAELNGRAVAGSRAFLEFDTAASRLTGNAGCNRLFGSYELVASRFDAGRIGTTKMACVSAGVSRAETAFLRALNDAKRLRVSGRTLTLLAGGKAVLKLRRPAGNGPAALAAKKWVLRSIDGKAINLVRGSAFMTLDPREGRVGGNGGCNSFGGGFEIAGDTIKFRDLLSTMMACGGGRTEVEVGFFERLRKAERFATVGNELRISRGGKVLLEFEGVNK